MNQSDVLSADPNDESTSRNRLWISEELQRAVSEARLVVIGCGGNGVLFVTSAAHLGFRRFVLCDPDALDATNLNRWPIAALGDVGRLKVEVVRDYLTARFGQIEVQSVPEAFPNAQVADALPSATFVISCLDRVHPRLQVDVLARSYQRTLFDLGTGFAREAQSGLPLAAGGQVLISRPSGPCLMCLGFNGQAARNNYFVPLGGAPEPSSLLLNNVVAALAAECLLSEFSGPQYLNRVSYDRETLSLQSDALEGRPDCRICGRDGARRVSSVERGRWLMHVLMERGGVRCKTAQA